MNPYTLALGLALNTARAEKECIDRIVLDIQFRPVADDVLAQAVHKASDKKRASLEQMFLAPIRELYTNQLGIPVEVAYFGPFDDSRQRNGWQITYMSTDDFQNEFLLEKYVKEFLDNDKECIQSPGLCNPLLFHVGSIADPLDKKIDVFADPKAQAAIEVYFPKKSQLQRRNDYINYIAVQTAHEIGHMFWLEHSYNTGSSDIMINYFNRYKLIHGQRGFTFSDGDKAKIQSQMCKPEETK